MEFQLPTTSVRVYGPAGSGKTKLGYGLIKRAIGEGTPVVLINTVKMHEHDVDAADFVDDIILCRTADEALVALRNVEFCQVPCLIVIEECWVFGIMIGDSTALEIVRLARHLQEVHQVVLISQRGVSIWTVGLRSIWSTVS
jgi:hypothetical protein